MPVPKKDVAVCPRHPRYNGGGTPPRGCMVCRARRWVRRIKKV